MELRFRPRHLEKAKSTGKRWLGAAGGLVAFLIALGLGQIGAEAVKAGMSKKSKQAQLLELNKSLPKILDDETRIDRVRLGQTSSEIVYDYTLFNLAADEIDRDELESRLKALRPGACASLDKLARENVYTLTYAYADKAGVPVTKMFVDKQWCAQNAR